MKHGDKMRRLKARLLDEAARVIGHAVLGCNDVSLREILNLALDNAAEKHLRDDLFLVMRHQGFDLPERFAEASTKIFAEEDARIERQRASAAQSRKKREARIAFEKSWPG